MNLKDWTCYENSQNYGFRVHIFVAQIHPKLMFYWSRIHPRATTRSFQLSSRLKTWVWDQISDQFNGILEQERAMNTCKISTKCTKFIKY